MSMRLYGYSKAAVAAAQSEPAEMAEVTLCAGPLALRKIAAFLEEAARLMETMGPAFDHLHLADRCAGFGDAPAFVVSTPDQK